MRPARRPGLVSATPRPLTKRRAAGGSSASARARASALVSGTLWATASLRSPSADWSTRAPLSPPLSSPPTHGVRGRLLERPAWRRRPSRVTVDARALAGEVGERRVNVAQLARRSRASAAPPPAAAWVFTLSVRSSSHSSASIARARSRRNARSLWLTWASTACCGPADVDVRRQAVVAGDLRGRRPRRRCVAERARAPRHAQVLEAVLGQHRERRRARLEVARLEPGDAPVEQRARRRATPRSPCRSRAICAVEVQEARARRRSRPSCRTWPRRGRARARPRRSADRAARR